jgi:zinc-ribbon domain
MVCQACGHPVESEVRYCSKCGAQVTGSQAGGSSVGYVPPVNYGAPPAYAMGPAYVPRVQRNVQTLGMLWCLFGAYRVIGGLIGMFFLRFAAMGGFAGNVWSHSRFGHGPAFLTALLPLVAMYTVIVAALALVVGYGLLTRQPWGRTVAIVAAVLALFKPLLGTGLGVYTLWVLAPEASGAEYQSIAARV